jgi:endonuclease G
MKAPSLAGIAKIRSNTENTKKQREDSLKAIHSGKPLDVEDEQKPKIKRMQVVAGMNEERATKLAQQPRAPSLDVCFLDLARAAASSVGRVLHNNSEFKGAGFMISNRLFLTNNHVIHNSARAMACLVEFNYELGVMGCPKAVTRFALAPNDFFVSSPQEDLDFTIVAIGNRVSGKGELSDFGFCPLRDTDDKHPLGEFVNIIHHPGESFKQIVLRAHLAAHTDEVLHYYANTRSGSSGSPVFNDQFEPIGIHHYRKPTRIALTPDGRPGPRDANEGIRISAIVKRINSEKNGLSQEQRALIDAALGCSFRHPSLLRRA